MPEQIVQIAGDAEALVLGRQAGENDSRLRDLAVALEHLADAERCRSQRERDRHRPGTDAKRARDPQTRLVSRLYTNTASGTRTAVQVAITIHPWAGQLPPASAVFPACTSQ